MPQSENKSVPLVGDFLGTKDNGPRLPRKDSAEKDDDSISKKMLDEVDAAIDRKAARAPEELVKAYEEGLAEVGIDRDEASKIMEKILIEQVYIREYNIGPVAVELRTRDYSDTLRISRLLETEAPTYNMSVQDFVARCNLAASLHRYKDKVFEHPDPKDQTRCNEVFHEKLDFVIALPHIVVGKLMNLSYKFDTLVAAVFADGAPQDF